MPFDRELLAAIRHFCLKLEGRELFILTDHKPLCHALGRLLVPWSACQQQHLTYISKLTQDIQHVPGKDNVLANALSLPPQLSCLAHANLPRRLGGPPAINLRFHYIFNIVDCSMRWHATYPVQDTSADTCIAALAKWISDFGVPATLTSDCGSKFTSSSWSAFCCSLSIEHIMTTAYHP